MLRTNKTNIVDAKGKPVYLRGINLGGWLMMEAYFMHSPNSPEHQFRNAFAKVNGQEALKDFDRRFRNNFIKESDLKNIAKIGFNCVRVPFHYRLIEAAPNKFSHSGMKYLDKVISWGKKYNVYIILDLHAAPGAQNHDWHSDSTGEARLWKTKSYQKRTLAIWKFVANRYKDEKIVAGYDLLNESVLNNTRLLNSFYKSAIKTIRSVDQNHILFIEGNKWAQDIACLDEFNDDNYALSIHSYEPLDFTFNFVPHLKYPLKSKKGSYNKQTIKKLLTRYQKISKKRGVPIFVGEFGVNNREGLYYEERWVRDTLNCFKEFGFHWTYWPYKAIKNFTFPDGLYSYIPNSPWVNRPGPVQGWETYPELWRKHKEDMTRSWRTDKFTVNKKILKELKNGI